jgi:hypothetical protein
MDDTSVDVNIRSIMDNVKLVIVQKDVFTRLAK